MSGASPCTPGRNKIRGRRVDAQLENGLSPGHEMTSPMRREWRRRWREFPPVGAPGEVKCE